MSILSQIRLLHSCWLSKPQGDRPVYQAIRRSQTRKIVELGLGTGCRARKMIEVAKLVSPQAEIHYVGVDLFEARSESDGPGLTLKAAHQLLRCDGVKVQLMPGNPSDVLSRIANSLGKVDLLIVPTEAESEGLAKIWFFVPRMLHDESLVFVEQSLGNDQKRLELKPREEIDDLATASVRRRAA